MNEQKDLVTETFSETGLLSKKIQNYKLRTQQLEMSEKVQECIEKEIPLIVEAPTGTGKSLAALVPAFERIMKTDEPVVVATSSIVLQEQYANKDIPMLEELYGFGVNPVLIKGRNNYLCPKKLNEAKNGKVGFTTSDYVSAFQDVLNWVSVTKTGDKSELDFVPPTPVWGAVACLDNNECTSKQCPFYDICPYYTERRKIQSSKLVVTNYHYLFSGLGEVGMLPKMKVLIMDEGHEVNAIARDFQERKYSMNSLKNQIDYFAKAAQRAEMDADAGGEAMVLGADMEIDQINATLTDMFVGLGHEFKKVVNKHYQRDFWQIEIPERTRLQKYVTAHIEALDFASNAANTYLNKYGFDFEEIPALAEMWGKESVEWFVSVAKTMDFFHSKARLLEYYFAYDEGQDDGDDIFWLEKFQESVAIHVKPTTGKGITEPLFRPDSELIPIVMSATLAANRSFDHLKEDLGITGKSKAEELIVSSPFNLSENLLWYLPPDCPAGNVSEHLPFALTEMTKIIKLLNGKTLCLFTSRKNVLEAERYFSRHLPSNIEILSQENMPKQKIIDAMKKNENAVIIGTRSFFTGVDIQGQNLSAVLIDKIPFPMIGDPVNDTLMSQPRGFDKYSLPEAIITIKQGFGRLNRTSSDKGIVAIFDGRLSTARYKNKIFNSFDFKIQATKSWSKVEEYVQWMKGEKDDELF